MSDLQSVIKKNGFRSDEEFFNLVSSVKLNVAGNLKKFKAWQEEDGTKSGLLAAFPELIRKVVINREIGGFSILPKAFLRLRELGHPGALTEELRPELGELETYHPDIKRDDPMLLQVIEEMGIENVGEGLKVVEIPGDIEWDVGRSEEGYEWVYEKHRTWF